MASNELGLFLADFVAPTSMAADTAADSLVRSVNVDSSSSLTIELSCRSYPDPSVLRSFEQLIAREYSLEKVMLSHDLDSEAADTQSDHANYCEKLVPWLLCHLRQSEKIPLSADDADLSYDKVRNTFKLKIDKHAGTQNTAKNILSFLRQHTAAKCDVKIDTSGANVRKDKQGKSVSKLKVNKTKKDKGKLIWGSDWSQRSRETLAEAISVEIKTAVVRGDVSFFEKFINRNGSVRVSFALTDDSSSVRVMLFCDERTADRLESNLKGSRAIVRGTTQFNHYRNECELKASGIRLLPPRKRRNDDAVEKRVELHIHSKMSKDDALIDAGDIVRQAAHFGHEAVAITDHGIVQGFPAAYEACKESAIAGKPIKLILGMEGYVVDDGQLLCYGLTDKTTQEFDSLEHGLTALSVAENDEYLFVKLAGLAKYEITIAKDDPGRLIKLKKLAEDVGQGPLLLDCIESIRILRRQGFKVEAGTPRVKFFMPYMIVTELKNFCKKYFPLDTFSSEFTEKIVTVEDLESNLQAFKCLWNSLSEKKLSYLNQMAGEIDFQQRRKLKSKHNHITLLAKNSLALYNLYRLVSVSLTEQFYFKPRITLSLLEFFRDDLIIGSACVSGEIYQGILKLFQANGQCYQKTKAALTESSLLQLCQRYDYLEIMPRSNNHFLTKSNDPQHQPVTLEGLEDLNRLIIDLAELAILPVCATGDAHYLEPEDDIFRRIITAKIFGVAENEIDSGLFFRTTEEMLAEFSYLGSEKAFQVVVENPKKIAAMVEDDLRPFPEGSFPPQIDSAPELLRQKTYEKALALYGRDGQLPPDIEKRIERELDAIIGNGFSVMYYIAAEVVKQSNKDGYIVGSRGSVGSSFVATLVGITEVNPLRPHYLCPKCKFYEKVDDVSFGSGYDLPPSGCPDCGADMQRDGHNIPFETFLGFDGDKQPDIDLNFSGFYQARAHSFIEKMFGENYTFRAGTISAYAEKNSLGLVNSYFEKLDENSPLVEKQRLAEKIVGVKQTTGQHPGGMVVVPNDYEIYDFTPIQYPANKRKEGIITTHFDFNSMHDTLLKLDILGHDDPSMLKLLSDWTGVSVTDIPIPDAKVMSLFSGVEVLGIESKDDQEIGTIGVPEMGTFIVRDMIREAKPKTYDNIIQLSGLSHGTGVWSGNAQDLIRDGTCTIDNVIGCRDGIMTTLLSYNLPKEDAFAIMERVRKGRGMTAEQEQLMLSCAVPKWYIESCRKIQYMFPRAHAVAYTISALRIAWFKVYYPEEYYAAAFTIRGAVDASYMLEDLDAIERRMTALSANSNLRSSATDLRIFYTLELVREMLRRGISFLPISLDYSAATKFLVEEKGKIRPPLASVPGISEKTAFPIIEERQKEAFLSIEDLKQRAGLNSAVIEELRLCGALEHLPASTQIDLFSLIDQS